MPAFISIIAVIEARLQMRDKSLKKENTQCEKDPFASVVLLSLESTLSVSGESSNGLSIFIDGDSFDFFRSFFLFRQIWPHPKSCREKSEAAAHILNGPFMMDPAENLRGRLC